MDVFAKSVGILKYLFIIFTLMFLFGQLITPYIGFSGLIFFEPQDGANDISATIALFFSSFTPAFHYSQLQSFLSFISVYTGFLITGFLMRLYFKSSS